MFLWIQATLIYFKNTEVKIVQETNSAKCMLKHKNILKVNFKKIMNELVMKRQYLHQI